MTIPKFQTAAAAAQRLCLPVDIVERSLLELARMGLVKRQGSGWVAAQSDIHLPRESLLNSIHHGNWRARAVLDAQSRPESSIHYTAVHSLSTADYERIKDLLLAFVDESRIIVGPSKEEELVCICLDTFRV